VNSSPGATGREFRIAFCQKYRCAPEQFERAVLRRCFPWWSRLPGAVLLGLNPRIFRRELSLIARLGEAQNASQVRQELEGYAYENARDRSFRTESLGLRLSRRRFVRLMRRVLPAMSPADEGPSGVPESP
jgi:hypothetical protein